jgi:hypothetical protein
VRPDIIQKKLDPKLGLDAGLDVPADRGQPISFDDNEYLPGVDGPMPPGFNTGRRLPQGVG